MVTVEKLVERRLAEETEVLGENLPQRHFVHHKSHVPRHGFEPDRHGGKPATNRLSYGVANFFPSFETVPSVDLCGSSIQVRSFPGE
jgi:hypothetical protein